MKEIELTKRELRVLSLQLENKADGFTVKQLRQLDKVLGMFESYVKDYNDGLNDVSARFREKIRSLDSSNPNYSSLVQELNNQLVEEVNGFDLLVGRNEVLIEVEDTDFDFVKGLWEVVNDSMNEVLSSFQITLS